MRKFQFKSAEIFSKLKYNVHLFPHSEYNILCSHQIWEHHLSDQEHGPSLELVNLELTKHTIQTNYFNIFKTVCGENDLKSDGLAILFRVEIYHLQVLILNLNSQKWSAVHFSLQYQYNVHQTGDKNRQIYQPEGITVLYLDIQTVAPNSLN